MGQPAPSFHKGNIMLLNKQPAPAFQHYPNDFLSDPHISLMTPEEVGIYWLLVNYCWKLGHLPDDFEVLAVYGRTTEERIKTVWAKRFQHIFFQDKSGNWVHPFLEDQKAKHLELRSKRKDAASARWSKQKTSADANAMQMECKDDAKDDAGAMQVECISSSSSSSSSSSISIESASTISEGVSANGRKPKRGSRLADDFAVTDQMVSWAKEKGLQIDVNLETEKFKNYYASVAGQKGVKLDWVATWKNWMLNARGNHNGTGRKKDIDQTLNEYQQWFNRLDA
jgi:uncharacterized protein YdaU (DUF1376 family)